MSANLHATLAELTAKRDALNTVIAALGNVMDLMEPISAQPVRLPPPMGARPPQPRPKVAARREKAARVPAPRQSTEKRVAKPVSERQAIVTAREDAILAALRRNDGVAKSETLRRAMPKEPDLNEEQRDDAYRNTMTRLKGKSAIGRTGDTWSITGLGSERA